MKRDPHGRADAGLSLLQRKWGTDRLKNAFGRPEHIPFRLFNEQHGKFIPAHAPDEPPIADASLQPGRTLYEQFVARGMSKRVVDFLEPIKVDQQQGQPPAALQCAPTGFVEHLLKHGPVRQPGQGIMACLSQSGSG